MKASVNVGKQRTLFEIENKGHVTLMLGMEVRSFYFINKLFV